MSTSFFSRAVSHALSYDSPTSSDSPLSDKTDVDSSGFIQSDHRAGGPHLCSIPFSCLVVSENYNRRVRFYDNEPMIRERARAVLNEEGIPYTTIYASGRQSKVDPEPEPIPTVVIITDKCSRRAARRIHRDLAPRFPGLSVELISDALRPHFRFPVSPSESIFPKWVTLCRQMISACKETGGTVPQWTSIECWRYGPNEEPRQNPVTVIVSVLKGQGSQDVFITDTARIRRLLATHHEYDVAILFQEGHTVQQGYEPILKLEALSRHVQPGVSLGISSCSARSSTLGGFIEIRRRGEQSWHSYALTCFHAVCPREYQHEFQPIRGAKAAFDRWEFSPLRPGDSMAPQLLKIDHPSAGDLWRAIESYDTTIASLKDYRFLRIERQIQQRDEGSIDAFVTETQEKFYQRISANIAHCEKKRDRFWKIFANGDYNFGAVFAGSGLYRRKVRQNGQPYILDWALVRLEYPERKAPNTPYLYDHPPVRDGEDFPEQRVFTEAGLLEYLGGFETVFKSGRSTNLTEGIFSEFPSCQLSRKYDPKNLEVSQIVDTWEAAFVGSRGKNFSEKGDSGSFVFTREGIVVGMVFGGRNDNAVTYVTPIEAILTDIKEVTGAVEARIAVTQMPR